MIISSAEEEIVKDLWGNTKILKLGEGCGKADTQA
jgi:hypothetical protein